MVNLPLEVTFGRSCEAHVYARAPPKPLPQPLRGRFRTSSGVPRTVAGPWRRARMRRMVTSRGKLTIEPESNSPRQPRSHFLMHSTLEFMQIGSRSRRAPPSGRCTRLRPHENDRAPPITSLGTGQPARNPGQATPQPKPPFTPLAAQAATPRTGDPGPTALAARHRLAARRRPLLTLPAPSPDRRRRATAP